MFFAVLLNQKELIQHSPQSRWTVRELNQQRQNKAQHNSHVSPSTVPTIAINPEFAESRCESVTLHAVSLQCLSEAQPPTRWHLGRFL